MVVADSVHVIAEIGVNHNGRLEAAVALVAAAVEAGADSVKFQTFKADRLASQETPKVPYQLRDTSSDSHLEMLRQLELSDAAHQDLLKFCRERGIEFLSTPYGVEDARFLVELGVGQMKTASADITDLPLHMYLAEVGIPTIVSTGMASADEIDKVSAIYRDSGTQLTLLHTTSEYPTPVPATNMSRMIALRRYGVPIGFSDHTQGNLAAVMAVALGASVIEKHFTLNRDDTGPDHFASAEPSEFKEYVSAIREASNRMGSDRFAPTEGELAMRRTSRKSVHLAKDRAVGDTLAAEDLILRRPGTGLNWSDCERLLGHRFTRPAKAGAMLHREDLQ